MKKDIFDWSISLCKNSAAPTFKALISLQCMSHMWRKKRILATYYESYAKDDSFAKTNANITNHLQQLTKETERVWSTALSSDRAFDHHLLNGTFVEGLSQEIHHNKKLYWCTKKDATLQKLAWHTFSLLNYKNMCAIRKLYNWKTEIHKFTIILTLNAL